VPASDRSVKSGAWSPSLITLGTYRGVG